MAETDASNELMDIDIGERAVTEVLDGDKGSDFGLSFMAFAGLVFMIISIAASPSHAFPNTCFVLSLLVFLIFGSAYLRKLHHRRLIESGKIPTYRSKNKTLLARAYRVQLDVDAYNALRQRWSAYISARDLGVMPALVDEARVLKLLLLIRERTMRQVDIFSLMNRAIATDKMVSAAGVRVALAANDAQDASDRLRVDISCCDEADPLLSEGRQELENFLAKA